MHTHPNTCDKTQADVPLITIQFTSKANEEVGFGELINYEDEGFLPTLCGRRGAPEYYTSLSIRLFLRLIRLNRCMVLKHSFSPL